MSTALAVVAIPGHDSEGTNLKSKTLAAHANDRLPSCLANTTAPGRLRAPKGPHAQIEGWPGQLYILFILLRLGSWVARASLQKKLRAGVRCKKAAGRSLSRHDPGKVLGHSGPDQKTCENCWCKQHRAQTPSNMGLLLFRRLLVKASRQAKFETRSLSLSLCDMVNVKRVLHHIGCDFRYPLRYSSRTSS